MQLCTGNECAMHTEKNNKICANSQFFITFSGCWRLHMRAEVDVRKSFFSAWLWPLKRRESCRVQRSRHIFSKMKRRKKMKWKTLCNARAIHWRVHGKVHYISRLVEQFQKKGKDTTAPGVPVCFAYMRISRIWISMFIHDFQFINLLSEIKWKMGMIMYKYIVGMPILKEKRKHTRKKTRWIYLWRDFFNVCTECWVKLYLHRF